MPFWPFNRIRVEPLTPPELQRRLVDAAYQGRGYLRRFCKAYQDQIEANVAALVKAPEGFEAQPEKTNRFAQGLGTAAQCLATECNSPALWNALTGTPEENPILRWQKFLNEFQDRMQRLEHDQLRDELGELLTEVKTFGGDHARQHEAFFYGRLGEVEFHSGRSDEAIELMEKALEICRRINDHEGVLAYLNNLAEIARYRGDTSRAISLLAEARDLLGRHRLVKESDDVARRIERLYAGEPLCRVVWRAGDKTGELDELQPAIGTNYKFEFVRNRPTLQKALRLTELGNEKAAAGELAEAIELYHQAAEVDPYDPDPHYQCGTALLDMGAPGQAAESFAQADRLAPGWYHARNNRHVAERIASGEYPREVWMIVRGLQDGGLSREIREQWSRKGIEQHPCFAPLYLLLGDALRDRDATEEAQATYRAGLAHADEPDIRTRLLCALVAILPPQSAERKELLREALSLEGNLVAQAMTRFLK